MINEVEQALLSDIGTVEISLLAKKLFSQLKEKETESWLEKEMNGMDREDIINLDLYYRRLSDCSTGVKLNGVYNGCTQYKGFLEFLIIEEYLIRDPIREVCETIKSFANSKKELYIDVGILSEDMICDVGLENFVSYDGPIHQITKIGISRYRLVESGFREKLYSRITDIQQKYGIQSSPKLKSKGPEMEINNINMGNGSEGDAIQSKDDSEVNNQKGFGNTQNSRSKLDKKAGLLSRFIGWLLRR